MYRSSKVKSLKRAGISGLLLAAAMTGGVALSSSLWHSAKSPTALASATAPSATAPSTVTPGATAPTVSAKITAATVTALTANSITVQSAAGVATTYALTSSTVVMVGHAKVGVAQLRVGERVFVVPTSGNSSVAGTIGVLPSSGGDDGGGDGSVNTVSFSSDN